MKKLKTPKPDLIPTNWKKKIESLGFTFFDEETRLVKTLNKENEGFITKGRVKCLCGNEESFGMRHLTNSAEDINYAYRNLYYMAFNEKHLRNDGFPEEFIESVKCKFKENNGEF